MFGDGESEQKIKDQKGLYMKVSQVPVSARDLWSCEICKNRQTQGSKLARSIQGHQCNSG